MNINIKLDKNFTAMFNKFAADYGQKMLQLNGFSEKQLNYTDFIDNFVDKNTVADASIDGNANVNTKDITSLIQQMNKPHSKLLAFNKIFCELNKKFGYKVACDWLKNEWDGHFYLHDASSSTYVPYSYKGTEVVTVLYKNKILLTSFEQLYDLVEENIELLSEEDQAFCKYTNDLEVLDKDNKWVKVLRVIRKPKTKDFHFIKSSNGLAEIVTSNHPVITSTGDKNAEDITNDDKIISELPNVKFGNKTEIYCLDYLNPNKAKYFRGKLFEGGDTHQEGQVCYFNATNPLQNKLICDFNLGWLVGMIIAQGSFSHDSICIHQNEGKIFNRIVEICEKKNLGYHIYQKNSYKGRETGAIVIRNQVFCDVFGNAFSNKEVSYNKKLNPDILDYNKEFLKGIIGGILDGDGYISNNSKKRIHIQNTSRTLINQLAYIIRLFGYTVRQQIPMIYGQNKEELAIKQKHYIYHLAFTPFKDMQLFDSIKIDEIGVEYLSSETEGMNVNKRYTFGYGEHNVSNNEILIKDSDQFVYDITTQTGHFMCNNILSHNCFAYDIEQLVRKGLFFIKNFNAQPPKHLTTYTDFVGEFVSWVSNRSSGACGLPSFLVYSYYFWRKDIEEGYLGMKKGSKEADYYRDQEFQRIIYKLNQPYLRVNQSAFTNFSILDRDYLIELFGGKEFPDGTFIIDEIEEIIEYEKAFMEVVSAVRQQNMMTFPVLTYSLLRSKDGKWGDEEFAKWCCKHNMKWNDSNFYISDNVTSLSNCCVTGDSIIKVYNKETDEEETYDIATFISKFDRSRITEFISPVKTGYYVKSYNYTTKEWQDKDIIGVIKKYNNYQFIYKIVLDDETEIDVTPDHTMELIDEQGIHIQVSAKNLDYNLKQGKQYKVIKEDGSEHTFKSVEKRTSDESYVYCLHIADFNNFNVNGINVGNCRLISDIDELGYFNSIGGTALEVGSVKVNTVNLARIAYENETKQGYLNQLGEEITLCLQALDIVRGIIKRNSEKGLLPNYNLDVIKFESQYNTIGVIGIYEVLQKYGMIEVDEFNNHSYTDEGIAFAKAIFDKIIEVKEKFRKDNGCNYKINIEQIPAERAAAILMYKDREFFPNEKYELPTYGNQWIPLAVKCTLSEKIKISALLDQFCNGGSISHINLSAPFNNFDQAWKILNQVADAGVKYFAFCVRISACKNNHGFFGDKCPVCGELKYTSYQRIVRFLVAETSYSSERKAQFKMRDWFDLNSGDDLTAR